MEQGELASVGCVERAARDGTANKQKSEVFLGRGIVVVVVVGKRVLWQLVGSHPVRNVLRWYWAKWDMTRD